MGSKIFKRSGSKKAQNQLARAVRHGLMEALEERRLLTLLGIGSAVTPLQDPEFQGFPTGQTLTYDYASQHFDAVDLPLVLEMTPSNTVFPGPSGTGEFTAEIHIQVDHTGHLIGGNPAGGPDVVVKGSFDYNGQHYDGTLLAGNVVQTPADTGFGYSDSGATQFDFRFTPAAGIAMGSFFTNKDIGALILGENSSYTYDFSHSFDALPKALIGAIDRPVQAPVTVGDFVWNDANANGIQDAGEAGINGVTLTLTGTNSSGVAVTDHTTTSGNGGYLFTEAPGTYIVTVDASNFTGAGALKGFAPSPTGAGTPATDSNPNPSGTTPSALPGGSSDLTIDFGFFVPTQNFSIIKSASSAVVAPYQPVTYTYTVTNTGNMTLTNIVVKDNGGTLGFLGDDFTVGTIPSLAAGASASLTATVIPPVTTSSVVNGQTVTAGVEIITTVLANGNVRVTYLQSFNINDNTYGTGAIGWPNGHKFGDLTGSDHLEFRFFDKAGNVAIDYYVDTITQATSAKLANGSTLRTYPSGYGTLGPFGGDGFMVSGDPNLIVDYDTSITDDLNNPLNVPFKASLIVNSPTSLKPGGSASNPNDVLVDLSKAPGGWNYINSYTTEVSAAAFAAGGGFGAIAIPDQHNSPSKLGVNQITTTPTDSKVTNTAYAFVDGNANGNFDTGELRTADATATVAIVTNPASLAGSVYVDANNNGVRDPGEVGIGGVTVTLVGTNTPVPINMTAVTLPDGSYGFGTLANPLPAGTYSITEATQPAGYGDGTDKAGTSGGAAGNDVITGIVLAANAKATGYTFGETLVGAASLSGTVYNDADNSAAQNGTEAGIAGATVLLFDSGNHLIATTTTAGNGAYGFTGISAGTYKVVEVQPSGYLDGRDTLGNLGGTLKNDKFSNVPIGAGDAGTGYNFGEILAVSTATSSVSKAFNATAIAPGNTIWFSSVYKMGGLNNTGTTAVYLRLVNSTITITTKAGAVYVIPVPNAKITFQNATTDATAGTTYNAATNTWETTIGKTTAGNAFLTAMPWTVPAGVTDLAGASFKWTGTFLDSSSAIDVSSWAAAAAVYNTTSPAYAVPSDLNAILVKPTDSNAGPAPYNNTDKAGTPELFKTKVIAGALGNGGTAYIGSYTANGNPTDVNVIPNLFVDDATETWLSSSVDPLS